MTSCHNSKMFNHWWFVQRGKEVGYVRNTYYTHWFRIPETSLYNLFPSIAYTIWKKKKLWPGKGSQLSLQDSWVSNKLHGADVGSYRQLLDRKEFHPSHRPSGHEHVPCRHRLWDSQLLIGGIGGTLNTFQTIIHPGRLTWNLQIHPFRKENDLPNLHVNLHGCIDNNSVEWSSKSGSDIVVAQRFGTVLVLFLPPAATQKNHNMGVSRAGMFLHETWRNEESGQKNHQSRYKKPCMLLTGYPDFLHQQQIED